jgi:Mrp family chromosome partitioning ATPase
MVLICSSVPREGKTTLAASFAVYTALLGRRVVLVDLDFRRPAIMSEIGGKADTGVLDLLDLDSLSPLTIQSVPGLGLDWLPVRRLPDDPLAPFATGQLQCLLQRLRKSYDCIVIDSPPLLAVSEGRLLASLVDKVLFVVKWASTRRDVAQNALELLRNARPLCENGQDVVWTVLTQIDLKKHARYRYGDAGETFVRYPQYFRLEGPAGAGRKPSKTAAQHGGYK